jgi:hypothetical protein
MKLVIDPDVKTIVEFIQERLPANRLASVASGVAAIAPLLWGHHQTEEIITLQMVSPPITAEASPQSTH